MTASLFEHDDPQDSGADFLRTPNGGRSELVCAFEGLSQQPFAVQQEKRVPKRIPEFGYLGADF